MEEYERNVRDKTGLFFEKFSSDLYSNFVTKITVSVNKNLKMTEKGSWPQSMSVSVSFLVAKLLRLHISVHYHPAFFPKATYKDTENIGVRYPRRVSKIRDTDLLSFYW